MNNPSANLAFDAAALQERVIGILSTHCNQEAFFDSGYDRDEVRTSSVLLLLSELSIEDGGIPEVCVILNKRSREVRQPGDLCCPGGAVEKLDRFLARLLPLWGPSFSRWPCWSELKTEQPADADFLALLYAAGLREGWEEMGLNPFRLTFLGPLPTSYLVLNQRPVHPLVAWVSRQRRFRLSWEVERIVQFPLRALLNPFNYGLSQALCTYRSGVEIRRESCGFPVFHL